MWEKIRQVFVGKRPKAVEEMGKKWQALFHAEDFSSLRKELTEGFKPKFDWDDGTGWHEGDFRELGELGGTTTVDGTQSGAVGSTAAGVERAPSNESRGNSGEGLRTALPGTGKRVKGKGSTTFSVSQMQARDAEYLDAVKRGDMATAQRMVDAARRAIPS